jgi:nucleoside-diphosphate-sugar epimerase
VSARTATIPRFAAVVAEKVDRSLQGGGRYVQAVHVLGELKDTIACDITRARTELGYEPAVGLLEGMRVSIRWCRARGALL